MSGSFTSFKGLFIALCCFLYPCINYAQVSPPPTVDEVSFACPLTDEAFFEVDIAPNEVVWYELTFDGAASSLSIDTEGSDIDTELGLYDSNGNLLTNNDDNGGGGTWSLIDLPTLAPGTYYIAIGEFNVNFGGGFGVVSTGTDSGGGIDLTIDLECVEGSAIITPPTVGTFSFTCPSTGSETQETTIDINEVVWYELNYDGVASSLSIDTDGSDIDTEIGLYSADGSLIDNNDDNGSGGTWSLIDLENFPPGTYYIAIGEFNVNFGNISFDVESTGTDTGGDIDITVSLTCSDQTNVAPPPIDVGAAFSCPVMETTEFPDVTIEPNQVIWFELSVDGVGNSFSIDTEGSSVDTEIGLYDSNGFLIENNDDNGGGGTWSLINTATLPAGVYYLAIGEFNVNFDDFSFGVESTGTDTGGSIFLSIALSCNEPPPCAISNTSLVGVVCNPADQDDAIVSVVFDVAQGSGDYNLVDADTDEVLGSITGAPTAGTAIGISGTVSGPTAAGQIVNVKVEDAQTGLPMELTNNGDFETGDLAGWQSFPTSASVFEITEDNPSSGAFAARLFNPVTTSGAVVKQANLGIGLVNAGDEVTVTFDARGQGDAGGVGIAELLSEIDGGGATSEVLGGAPFSIDPNFNFNNWTTFSFTTTAGADVTNGISLQFVAATGAAPGSVMNLFIDNVSVTVNGEACMGLPVEVTLPECISMECIISNISVLSTECITGSEDGYNVTVGFDVDNGSGSYALVDAANPDQVIGTVEGDMIATGLSISGPTNSSITELKVIDALIGGPEELTSNGGFEAGDVSEWQYFPTANSIFETITDNPSDGVFAGRLFNPDPFSAAVIKQANIGIGQVNPGDEITITFDARGQGDNGGVGIAELFSEVAGGGVSASELLGGAPFSLDSDFNFNEWTTFSYTVTAGPDVSGGVSLQFVAATGEPGSVMNLFIDNVSVTVESMCMGDPITPTPPECPGANVEFCVDVSCQDIGPGDEVRVFGSFEPFGSPGFFNPFLFPAFEEDADNPGVFCGTIFVTATPALEYKFIVTNGGQIVNEEQFAPDEPCTTTPFGFTNRVLEVVDDQDAAVRFGWLSCDENCLQLPDLPIDFQGEGIFQYSILDFGGTSTVLGTDPEVPGNTVACTEKTPGAETFAGTIVPFIGLENPIPLTGAFPLITVDVFAPAAGIPVLLKIEDSDSSNPPADPATVFAEVFDTTTTDGWQTLLFDFNQSTNMPFDEDIMYDRFVIFFDFGNAGDGSTYCFDNIQICDEDLEISCPEDVTVEAGESSTPDVTGMATADFVCAEPEITFSDASDQTAEGCSQFNFIITRTFTADSPDGMTSESCVQFITVEDTQAPDLVCNTILVRTDDQGNIELDDDDLAAVIDGTTDVDPDFTAEFTQTNFDCSDIDPDDLQITVGVEVEDCSGNQAECTVSLDVQPDFLDFDFSCILEVNATLNEDCQDILLPEQLLTGDFACLDLFNFDIVVMDEDPSNGPIIDGCGRFQYTIVEPDPGEAPAPPVNGFTGDLAEANWTVDDSGGGNAAFTTEELVLSTAADDGVTASYMFMEEGEFTFDFAVALETNIIDDEFFIIYDFDGNLIEAYSYQDGGITGNLFEDSGTLTVDVQPGFTIEFQLLGDGFQTGGVTSTATISNIVFQPAIAADAFNAEQFTNCWGFVNAEDKISPTLADSLVAPAPLFCTDIGDINVTTLPLEVSRCWIQSGDNGNTLMSSMNLQLRNRLLAGGGIPNFLDNCSDVEICVNDVVSDNGDCTNVVLTRTFTARDGLDCTSVSGEENEPDVYSYDILFIRPTLDDVEGVAEEARFECDDDTFPLLPPNQFGDENPAPQLADFPFFPGPDGPIFLGENFCNIVSSFQDGPRIETCDQTYKVVRTFTVIDWCEPDVIRTFTQLVKVGDFDAPDITAPTQDLNFNGVPDQEEGLGPIFFSTSNSDCSASFIVPGGNATDNCDPNPSVSVFIYPFQDVTASPFGPFEVGGGAFAIPSGLHTIRYIASDDCENADTLDVPILIDDRSAPIAICEDGLDIAFGGSGNAIITPDDIDRASYDECSDITLLVAFVGDDNQPLTDQQTLALTGIAQGGWRPSIELTCQILDDDPDSQDFVAIGLQVADAEGNTNSCWLDVLVEDKVAPQCVAPAPVSINCNDPDIETLPQDLDAAFDDDPESVGAQLDVLFGEVNGLDNCGIESVTQDVQDARNSCGVGSIIRTFSVADGEGLVSQNTCVQIVTVLGIHDYTIVFPADFETEQCIDPTFNGVTFEERGCDLLTTTVVIDTFQATADECYKLRLTYEVLNWCEYGTEAAPYVIPRDADGDDILEERTFLHVLPRDESTEDDDIAWLDRDNNRFNGFISPLDEDDPNGQVPGASSQPYGTDASRGAFLYRQFIKVYDDTPPVVTNLTDDLVFEDLEGSCDEEVILTIGVNDACSSPDDYTATADLDPFFMDLDGDDILTLADFEATTNAMLFPNAVNNNDGTFTVSFNVNLPIGRHALRLRATDGCANAETILVIFEVTDAKAPTPVCINGLTVTLMPDGEGGGTAAVWANEYVVSDSGDCTDPVKFTIHHPDEFDALDDGSQIPDPEVDTGIVLDCDDRGMLVVRIYAIDGAGQADYCQTTLMVQQFQDGVCGNTGGGNILGTVESPAGTATPDVEMSISDNGSMSQTTYTDQLGAYGFTELTLEEDYTVDPELIAEVNVATAVTTYDALLINRHILGIAELESPYQHVVADVNMDDQINVLDVVHIRMVIMGQTTMYPQGPSWRFVDRDYEFSADASDWLTESFPEVYNANDLQGDILSADFYALEMGNVSEGSIASSNDLGSSVDRNSRSNAELLATMLGMSADEQSSADDILRAGNTYEVRFTAEDLYGLQGTLELGAGLELVDINYGRATAQNVNLEQAAEGVIPFSWDDAAAATSSADPDSYRGEVLFTLSVRATTDAELSDLLSLTGRITGAEAYPLTGGVSNLVLGFLADEQSSADEFSLRQNVPNPVDGVTQIGFTLPKAETAVLTIRDVQGRTVIVREIEGHAGTNLVPLNRSELGASGVYSYTLVAGQHAATKQMIIR